MYKTWLFFTAGGLFTSVYSNAVRRYPIMRKPMLHVVCTGIGCYIGYTVHRYEETAEERTESYQDQKVGPSQWPLVTTWRASYQGPCRQLRNNREREGEREL